MDSLTTLAATLPLQQQIELTLERRAHDRLRPVLLPLAPRLAELFVATRALPLERVEALVGRLITDHCDADEGGDAPVHDPDEVREHVGIIMRVARTDRQRHEQPQ